MNRVDDIHINSSESSHLPARVSAAAGTSVAIARFNVLLLIKKTNNKTNGAAESAFGICYRATTGDNFGDETRILAGREGGD